VEGEELGIALLCMQLSYYTPAPHSEDSEYLPTPLDRKINEDIPPSPNGSPISIQSCKRSLLACPIANES
jgi:hypothetical protein